MAKQRKLKQVYGNWEESYKQLPRCPLAMNDSLPRTIIDFHTRPTIERGRLVPGKTTFQRGFWAFKPCIRGFDIVSQLYKLMELGCTKVTGTKEKTVINQKNNKG